MRVGRSHLWQGVALGLTAALLWTSAADAGGLAASLRKHVEEFVVARAGGSVDSISVPPLPDFELPGFDARDLRIDLTTRARPPFDGAVAVNVTISNEEAVLKRGVVTAQVAASTRVWVAARELPRGARIGEDDVRLAKVELRALPGDRASTLEDIVGLQLKRSLREGVVLRKRHLAPVSVVERGQVVRIVLRAAGLEIVGKGKAVSNGAIGESIRVVNTDSRREVVGRVAEDGAVHVDL